MPRPYTIHEKPIFVPYTCVQCGVGEGRREWFLDLGFPLDHYFDISNQAIYLCNECYSSMTSEVGRLIQVFRKDHEKWTGGEEVSYSWIESQEGNVNDVRESESGDTTTGIEGDSEEPTGIDSGSDGNDQDSEPNDSEPESTNSGDADSTDDSNPDESGQPFTAVFGESS